MSALTVLAAGDALTMSTREIAELTGKEHRNVLRDARAMLVELHGEDRVLSFEQTVNRPNPSGGAPIASVVIALPKRECLILVSGYSVAMRAAIIDRWQELEAGSTPRTFAQALRLAAEQQERIEAQQAALAIAAPKVEFVDKYVESTGNKGFRQVAKLLGANETAFRSFLTERRVMYRVGGEWMPFQAHIDAGRFVVKTGTSDVSGHAFNTAKFTPKGVEWISRLWREHEAAHA